MSEEDTYDKIDRFLAGNMGKEELDAFEQRIQHDADLKEEVEIQAKVNQVFGDKKLTELSGKIEQVLAQNRPNQIIERPSKRIGWAYRFAAVLLLLIMSAIILFYMNRDAEPVDANALFAAHVVFPDSLLAQASLRGDTTLVPTTDSIYLQLQSLWQAADGLYQSKAFTDVLDAFLKIEQIEQRTLSETSSKLHYFRGMVLMQMEQYPQALVEFRQIKIDYTEEAKWNVAMILLFKENRTSEALDILQEIANSQQARSIDAQKLMEAFAD